MDITEVAEVVEDINYLVTEVKSFAKHIESHAELSGKFSQTVQLRRPHPAERPKK